MVLLKSNDGLTMEVDETIALQSKMVKLSLEESSPEHGIDLHNVNGETLAKIVEYLTKQNEFTSNKPKKITESSPELQDDVKKAEEALKAWQKEVEAWEEVYMDVDMDMLYNLYLASNYMDIQGLLFLCAEKVAGLIRGKTVKQMREILNIENDFTKEEEEKCRAPNAWAFTDE